MRAGSPLEATSCAAQTGPTPHSANNSGTSSLTIASSSASSSASSASSCCTRRARAPRRCRRATLSRSRQPGAAQRAEPHPQTLRRRDEHGLELVERRRPGLDEPAPLEQEQPQILAPAAPARPGEALAGDQPPRRQGGVDQIALAAPALASPWPFAFEDRGAACLQEPGQAGPVAAAALDREGRTPQPFCPLEQTRVAASAGRKLAGIELPAEPIAGDRDVRLLVRVDSDCHRPSHRLASLSSNNDWPWTGLCRARTQASIRSPASHADGGGRQVPRKAFRQLCRGSSRRRPHFPLSAGRREPALLRRYTALPVRPSNAPADSAAPTKRPCGLCPCGRLTHLL